MFLSNIVRQMTNPDTRFSYITFPASNSVSSELRVQLNTNQLGLTSRNAVLNEFDNIRLQPPINPGQFTTQSLVDAFSVGARQVFTCSPTATANCEAASGDRPNVQNVAVLVIFSQFDANLVATTLATLQVDVLYLVPVGVGINVPTNLADNAQTVQVFNPNQLRTPVPVNGVIDQLITCPIVTGTRQFHIPQHCRALAEHFLHARPMKRN